MVRMRCRISEDDEEATARSKLDATLTEHLLDSDERAFVEPLLASLLAIAEEHASHERHDLFAPWRLFFERLANTYPTVLVLEDMQWADGARDIATSRRCISARSWRRRWQSCSTASFPASRSRCATRSSHAPRGAAPCS